MRTRRGKVIAWSSVALGVVVLAVCAFVLRDLVVEEWNIHKLNSGDEEERRAAIVKLAEMGSVRTVPHILQAIAGRNIRLWEIGMTWVQDDTHFTRVISSREIWIGIIPGVSDTGMSTPIMNYYLSKPAAITIYFYPSRRVIVFYLWALQRLSHVAGSATILYFVRGLEHEHKSARLLSALHLGLFGPQADTAAPALRKALQDSDEDVAEFAGWALKSIQKREPIWQGEAGDEGSGIR